MKNLFAIALVALLMVASVSQAGRRGCCGSGCGSCAAGYAGCCQAFYYAPPVTVFYQPMPVGPVIQAPPVVYAAPTAPVFHGCFSGCCGGQCVR